MSINFYLIFASSGLALTILFNYFNFNFPTRSPDLQQTSLKTLSKEAQLYHQGQDNIYQGNYHKAIVNLNRAIIINSQSATAYNLLGEAYLGLKDFSQALASFERAIDLDPQLARAYFNRALTYRELKKSKEEITNFQQVLALNSDNLATYYYQRLANLNLIDDDYRDYTAIVSLQPSNAREYYYRANFYKKLGNYQKALIDYNKAISLNSNYIDAYQERASLRRYQFQDLSGALTDYECAIKINPQNIHSYFGRAQIYQELGDLEAAIFEYSRWIKVNPESGYLYRGIAKKQWQDSQGAIEDFTKSISFNPNDTYPYYLRSQE